MADFWERLQSRALPEETLLLPLPGGDPVPVTLRALLPAEWEALCAEHAATGQDPATGKDVEPGTIDTRSMRPALLAASVVAPEGSPPKDPAWWEQLAKQGGATAGELDALDECCWELNRRAPARPDLGKDSAATEDSPRP